MRSTAIRSLKYLSQLAQSDLIVSKSRQELGIPLDACVLLFFGTHRESKGYVTPLQGVLRFAPSERPWLLCAAPVISGDDRTLSA